MPILGIPASTHLHSFRTPFGFWRIGRLLLGDLAQLLVEALFVVVRLNLAGGLLELLDLRKFLA
jgi:hypothetical protein